MILDQRVFHQSTDISMLVNDYRTGAHTFDYATGEYLYIASHLPFNNLYFEVGTANAVPATVSVEIWWGNAWVAAVDVIDQTSGLTASGRLHWNTHIDKGWDIEQRGSDVTGITAAIYNMYWLRLSWSATLTSTMTLKYIGQKFANDDILTSYYADLGTLALKEAFETGKTTWDEQHYMAAERIVADLRNRSIIKTRGQILNYSLYEEPACHKVAAIVYSGMGKPYLEQTAAAAALYKDTLNMKHFDVDKNADGSLNNRERNFTTEYLSR